MTPFAELRLWLREGPRTERRLVGAVGVVAAVLLVWALIPGSSPSSSTVAAAGSPSASSNGTAAGGAAAPSSGAAAGASGASISSGGANPSGSAAVSGATSGSGTYSGPGGAASSGAAVASSTGTPTSGKSSGSACAASSAAGVTKTQITVGIDLWDIGAADSAESIPSEQDQIKANNAIAAYYNKLGGIQCRTIVPKYYDDNPFDSSEEQANCLQMAQDHDFAVLNSLVQSSEATCVAQEKIPNFWTVPPHTDLMQQYYPYLLSWEADSDRVIAVPEEALDVKSLRRSR
jgi:hypothetical protein